MTSAKKHVMMGLKSAGQGQRPMALIRSGAVFAAENQEEGAYTFVSCVTAPKFPCSGFRLVGRNEIRRDWPELPAGWELLAWDGRTPER